MFVFKSFFTVGLWVLCLTCASALAQTDVQTESDTTRKKAKRTKRETLASDTLPSIFDHKTDVDSPRVKKRRKLDAAYYEHSNTAQPDTIVTSPKRKKKQTADTLLGRQNEIFETHNNDLVDDVVSDTVEKTKRRSRKVEVDSLLNSDSTPVKPRHRKKQDAGDIAITDTLQMPEAMEQIQQAPLTSDQIAAMLLDYGNKSMEQSDFNQAVLYFDSLIAYYPGTFQYKIAYYFRGKAKMALGDDKAAQSDFNFFNQLDQCQSNFCADAHYNLAVLNFKFGDYAACMTELQHVLQDSTYKNHKYGYFYRGFCSAANEQYISAIQDLTRFIALDGNKTYSSAEALYYRGFYKAQVKDNRGAISDYDKAIEMYEAGINSKAGKQYAQKLTDTYVMRALAKSEIKKYDEAIADYNLAIKLNPNYATAYRLKGLAEIGKGDTESGCLNLSRAGELGANEAYEDIKQHCR